MSFWPVLGMWLGMTAVMMGPVVFPWLRALHRVAGGEFRADGSRPAGRGNREPTGDRSRHSRRSAAALFPFAGGYMVAWAAFSALAAALHVTLAAMSLPVPFAMDAPALSAAALGMAGTFQLTRLKAACLSHCRSPAGFMLTRWRPGAAAAARLGLEHGLHCVGCCWALMALALVVGMIDLVWMGLLMAVMVAETTLPFGARLTRPLGVALLVLGAACLAVSRLP